MKKQTLNEPERAECEIVRLRPGAMLLNEMPEMSWGLLRRMRDMLAIAACMTMSACEKPLLDGMYAEDGNVIIHLSPFTTQPMDNATTRTADDKAMTRSALSDAMAKLNVQVFEKGTSNKMYDKIKTQTSGDVSFGTLALSLPEGDYDVLCVGHSSSRSATLASDKVSFTAQNGRKITDTFWVMDAIEVRGETELELDWTMDRATALFRMVITDEVPEEVTQFKFEYSGGSADFNPHNGNGITNSKQNEQRDLSDDNQYDIYTFPRGNKLTIKAYALDSDDNIVSQREFVDVTVKAKYVTIYRGAFFDGSSGVINGNTLTLSVNDEWEGTYEGEF